MKDSTKTESISESLRSHYGHYAVTTVTTRSLRGYYAVTTWSLRSLRDTAKQLERRNGKAEFHQFRDVRFMSMFVCLRRMCGKSPHVSAMFFKHVIFPSIERNGFVMHVNPCSAQQLLTAFRFQQCRCLSVFIFDPHATSHKVSQSNGMVRMSFHVEDITMQRHRRIVQHGDGSPCLIRKALSEKMVDGDARFFHLRSSRNAKDTAVSKEAESTVFFISMRTDGSSAATMLPAR